MTAIVFVFCVFVLAGLVKGVIGLGLPTVALGLLSLAMPPAEAAAMLIVPSFVTNVWQLAAGGHLGNLWRRLRPMLLGICGGTWLGGYLLAGAPLPAAIAMLGAALLLYAAAGLGKVRFTVAAAREAWLAPVVGAATGLVTAATGVFVIPAVPYLQALHLEKDALVQALGLAFTVSTVALAISLALNGTLHMANAGASALAIVPALAGMAIGQVIRTRARPETFRRCFFIGLLLLGTHLLLKGALG